MKIGWDTSHLEFTIADYYYFGKLSDLLLNSGFLVDEVKDFDTLNRYDTIVFNYPEKPFNDAEVNKIDSCRLLQKRGRSWGEHKRDNEAFRSYLEFKRGA